MDQVFQEIWNISKYSPQAINLIQNLILEIQRTFEENAVRTTIPDSSEFFDIAQEVIRSYKMSALNTLQWELAKAIDDNQAEFDYPPFKEKLYRAFSNPEMIGFYINESSKRIDVKINAEDFAGSPEEYSTAVQSAKLLMENPGKNDAMMSSFIWQRFIYSVAREGRSFFNLVRRYKKSGRKGRIKKDRTKEAIERYKKIIADRMSFLEDKAPFWYILNYGSIGYGARVQGEGFPYPNLPPTNFIEKAEYAIQIDINLELKLQLTRINSQKNATVANRLQSSYDELIYIKEQLDNASINLANLEVGEFITKLKLLDKEVKFYVKQRANKTKYIGYTSFRL